MEWLFDPIRVSVTNNDVEKTLKYLQEGADPNLITPQRLSLLHVAVRQNNMVMAQLLLKFGANPNARGPAGETPLHHVCGGRRSAQTHQITYDLCTNGADPMQKDYNGVTPMDVARKRSDPVIIKMLTQAVEMLTGGCSRIFKRRNLKYKQKRSKKEMDEDEGDEKDHEDDKESIKEEVDKEEGNDDKGVGAYVKLEGGTYLCIKNEDKENQCPQLGKEDFNGTVGSVPRREGKRKSKNREVQQEPKLSKISLVSEKESEEKANRTKRRRQRQKLKKAAMLLENWNKENVPIRQQAPLLPCPPMRNMLPLPYPMPHEDWQSGGYVQLDHNYSRNPVCCLMGDCSLHSYPQIQYPKGFCRSTKRKRNQVNSKLSWRSQNDGLSPPIDSSLNYCLSEIFDSYTMILHCPSTTFSVLCQEYTDEKLVVSHELTLKRLKLQEVQCRYKHVLPTLASIGRELLEEVESNRPTWTTGNDLVVRMADKVTKEAIRIITLVGMTSSIRRMSLVQKNLEIGGHDDLGMEMIVQHFFSAHEKLVLNVAMRESKQSTFLSLPSPNVNRVLNDIRACTEERRFIVVGQMA